MPDQVVKDAVDSAGTTSAVAIVYRNYRGEVARRMIVPIRVWHGATEWHPAEQWLMDALDVEKGAVRSFALKDILNFDPE